MCQREHVDAKKIKKLMIDLDLTMNDLATRSGYSRQHVARVLYGRYRSPHAERRILDAIESVRKSRLAA